MSLRLEISPKAEKSLSDQFDWYQRQAGAEVARRYIGAFRATVELLTSNPKIGTVRNFQRPSLRGIRVKAIESPFGAHLVFYRFDLNLLKVEFVLHGARDLPRHLCEARNIYSSSKPADMLPVPEVQIGAS